MTEENKDGITNEPVDQTTITNDEEVVITNDEVSEEVKKKMDTLSIQKSKWREKALAYEQELAKLKPKLTEPKIEETVIKDIQELKLSEKKRQFGYRHNLSPEETDILFKFAGSNNPDDAIKDPFFQAGLAQTRQAKRVADAIPSGNNRVPKVDGKTFKDMTEEERKKNWGNLLK